MKEHPLKAPSPDLWRPVPIWATVQSASGTQTGRQRGQRLPTSWRAIQWPQNASGPGQYRGGEQGAKQGSKSNALRGGKRNLMLKRTFYRRLSDWLHRACDLAMMFSLSRDEWLEGQRLYARSLNRLNGVATAMFSLLALLFLCVALAQRNFVPGMLGLIFAWGALDDPVFSRLRLRTRWKRIAPEGVIRWGYVFQTEGFLFRTGGDENGFSARWDCVVRRLEGRHVWVLVTNNKTFRLFIIPKRIIETPENASEWAIVEAHFAAPAAPPIALP